MFLSTLGLWTIGGSEGPSWLGDLGPSGGGAENSDDNNDRGDSEVYAVDVV